MTQKGKGFFADAYNKVKNGINFLKEGKYISRYANKAAMGITPFNPAIGGFLSTVGGVADQFGFGHRAGMAINMNPIVRTRVVTAKKRRRKRVKMNGCGKKARK